MKHTIYSAATPRTIRCNNPTCGVEVITTSRTQKYCKPCAKAKTANRSRAYQKQRKQGSKQSTTPP